MRINMLKLNQKKTKATKRKIDNSDKTSNRLILYLYYTQFICFRGKWVVYWLFETNIFEPQFYPVEYKVLSSNLILPISLVNRSFSSLLPFWLERHVFYQLIVSTSHT